MYCFLKNISLTEISPLAQSGESERASISSAHPWKVAVDIVLSSLNNRIKTFLI